MECWRWYLGMLSLKRDGDRVNLFYLFNPFVQVDDILHRQLMIFYNLAQETILTCIDGILMGKPGFLSQQRLKLKSDL